MTAPQPLSFWVRTLDMLMQDEFARAANGAGIDEGQWQVLTRLRTGAVADDVLHEGLAQFVPADATVDDVVRAAEKAGLVQHQANEWRLTDKGFDRVAQVEEQTLGDLQGRAFADVADDDRERVLATLEKVATNLGWRPA
ncbi:hypothetical protein [Nocardioides sp. MH1]|uniref:hypothetical protein n=1 Tax=Nocardioides sp. MH1 TaxID=3242490 RepID=UPI003521B7CE